MEFELEGLPGEEMINAGLRDLEEGKVTVPALLVAIGAPRLARLNIQFTIPDLPDWPEMCLYRLLCQEDPQQGYARYNGLTRLLVSFERALEREQGDVLRAER